MGNSEPNFLGSAKVDLVIDEVRKMEEAKLK
jgi:hypothetical protein